MPYPVTESRAVPCILAVIFLAMSIIYTSLVTAGENRTAAGQKLAQEYCQACHHFTGTDQAGNVAPAFVAMKSRFPQRKPLTDIIYNAQEVKPHTMMPPFGKNHIITSEEIEKVIDFLYTL